MRQLKITQQITNRSDASLDKYLSDISREEMITAEEEVELAQRIKQGDDLALDKMVKANLRFVVSVAKQYQNQGLTLPDLINEGNLGLIKAAKRFDETRGFKFISYAVWWIRQSILQAVAEQSRIVRLPLNRLGAINKVRRALSTLEQQHERTPSVDEICEVVDLNKSEIEQSLKSNGKHISMDAPLNNDDDSMSLYDILANNNMPLPEDAMVYESLQKEVKRTISILAPREQNVLIHFFGLNGQKALSLDEIGEKYELTRERVRQLKEKALRRIKQHSKTHKLRSYLG